MHEMGLIVTLGLLTILSLGNLEMKDMIEWRGNY